MNIFKIFSKKSNVIYNPVYKVLDIARYIVEYSYNNTVISVEELVTILMWSQMYHIGKHLTPLFREEIYATKNGIEIPALNNYYESLFNYNKKEHNYRNILVSDKNEYIGTMLTSIYKRVIKMAPRQLYRSVVKDLIYRCSYKSMNEYNIIPKSFIRSYMLYNDSLMLLNEVWED